VLVKLNAATVDEYIPESRRIASEDNVVLIVSQLLDAIACNNDLFQNLILVCWAWQSELPLNSFI
jgi:hypothetical protein